MIEIKRNCQLLKTINFSIKSFKRLLHFVVNQWMSLWVFVCWSDKRNNSKASVWFIIKMTHKWISNVNICSLHPFLCKLKTYHIRPKKSWAKANSYLVLYRTTKTILRILFSWHLQSGRRSEHIWNLRILTQSFQSDVCECQCISNILYTMKREFQCLT